MVFLHRIQWLPTSLFFAFGACALAPPSTPRDLSLQKIDGPPYKLTVQIVDDEGQAAAGAYVRVMECCHTEAGPCGRIPVDEQGTGRFDVCPEADGIVRITITPDPKSYRVPPINEFEINKDTTVTVTVTRHQKVLRHLKKD